MVELRLSPQALHGCRAEHSLLRLGKSSAFALQHPQVFTQGALKKSHQTRVFSRTSFSPSSPCGTINLHGMAWAGAGSHASRGTSGYEHPSPPRAALYPAWGTPCPGAAGKAGQELGAGVSVLFTYVFMALIPCEHGYQHELERGRG